MLPFVTPTTDMRRDDQRATDHYRGRDSSRSVWQGVLILAVIVAAIALAVALATSGDSGNQLEPTPRVQQQ